MMLMGRDIENYDRRKTGGTKSWSSPITRNSKGQRGCDSGIPSPFEFGQAQLGKVCGNTTISAGRKSRSHASSFRNVHSLNFGGMNGSCVMSTRAGRSPRIDSTPHCVNTESPTSLNFLDVSPTDREPSNRISYDQTLLVKGYFRLNQKDVDQIRNKYRDQGTVHNVDQSTLQDARPEKEAGQCATYAAEPVIRVGPENLRAIHLPILSQLVINSLKVVH